MEVIPADLVQ